MRGLFLKIFGILWLAQSLVFIITTFLIVRQHFPNRNVGGDAIDSGLHFNASMAAADFHSGGCNGFATSVRRNEPRGAALFTADGKLLCTTPGAPSLSGLDLHFPNRIDGHPFHGSFIWTVPIYTLDGNLEYIWFQPEPTGHTRQFSWSHDLLHFAFPQLPVAIAVLGLATSILIVVFTRPIVRLRLAARELAEGNLAARVEQKPLRENQPTDEFQALNHDFNHMAERLEQLVAAQRLLLRDVSHELRSPLARLSVALELAREDAPAESEQHLVRIERETERLNQLIGQLLSLSSMEAAEKSADRATSFTTLSLNTLCEQLLPDAEYEAQRRPCTVTLHEDAQVTLKGNAELLHRALENVVRNAIRYTAPDTEVAIHLSTTTLNAQSAALIDITDHGPGIPATDLERILEPFYRVDTSRTSSTGGFGVGLAIADRAIRLHGGTLKATNRPTGGTSIQIILPIT